MIDEWVNRQSKQSCGISSYHITKLHTNPNITHKSSHPGRNCYSCIVHKIIEDLPGSAGAVADVRDQDLQTVTQPQVLYGGKHAAGRMGKVLKPACQQCQARLPTQEQESKACSITVLSHMGGWTSLDGRAAAGKQAMHMHSIPVTKA